MIERHGCARKKLMSFSSGGKRHSHPVVLALYHELLHRIEQKRVVLSQPLSIIDSVMPARRAWRGVGGETERVATRERFTILVMFTAWKWSMEQKSKIPSHANRKKKTRCTFTHHVHAHDPH